VTLAERARDLAGRLMRDEPLRLRHLAGVAARCETLGVTVAAPALDALVAAGWLHDIGYLPALRHSGFHPLDGALHLRSEGWPEQVCDLVAHHSGSRFVARVRGLDEPMGQFTFTENAASDVLTAADNTTRQDGSSVTVSERLAEKLLRHGPDWPGALANPARDDYIVAAAARVCARLTELGADDPYLA
jgi:predicted hydrolase (HD superfamily)